MTNSASETLFNLSPILNELTNIIIGLDLKNNIVDFNSAAQDYFNCTSKNAIGVDFNEFSKRVDFNLPFTANAVIEKGLIAFPDTFPSKAGHKYNVAWKVMPLHGANKTVYGFIIIGQDSTRELAAQDATKSIQRRLESLIELMTGYYWWKDTKGVYQGCNGRVVSVLGFTSQDEVIGKTDFELPWVDQAPDLVRNDKEVMESGVPIQRREETTLKDGRTLTFLVTKMALRDEHGKIIGTMGNAVDITAEKNAYIQQEAFKKAEMANKAKSETIADMSHDLRTPLAGILGMAELLEKRVPEKDKEIAHTISRASKALLNLFNEIIEDIKIETGQLPLRDDTIELRAVVEDIVDLLIPSIEDKHLQLSINIDDAVPVFIVGDHSRFRRILLNLVSNSIKFTQKGEIVISIQLSKPINDHDIALQISVKDTGVGIPEDQLQHVFKRFTRLPSAYQGAVQGIGIGLSIVKQFAQDMNGDVEVRSKEGEGTSFICQLPFNKIKNKAASNKEAASLS